MFNVILHYLFEFVNGKFGFSGKYLIGLLPSQNKPSLSIEKVSGYNLSREYKKVEQNGSAVFKPAEKNGEGKH